MARRLPRISLWFCLITLCIFISKAADELRYSGQSSCSHGDLTRKGKCLCQPCWMGDNCDQPVNRHQPTFDKETYIIEVSEPYANGEPFLYPTAEDKDLEQTCKGLEFCPCADKSYYISSGNEEALFSINPHTGALSISDSNYLLQDSYTITIAVRNTFQGMESMEDQKAKVHVLNPFAADPNIFEVHERERRAPSSPVGNVTFQLTKMEPYSNTTSMSVGSRVRFRLQITFPATETDMLVELFTPDNDTTVMILCDVNVTSVGSKLVYTGSITPTMDARETGSIMYDRAIINIGNVSNTGCVTMEDCSIVIEYEAIMIENDQTTPNGIYWVSAGAEYNNEMEVWVGQASFTVDPNDKTVSESPTFNFTGPSVLPIGSAAIFETDIYLPYPSTDLKFDAFSPLNTSSVMSICSARIKYMSDNFVCGFDSNNVSTQYYPDPTGVGNYMGHIEIGTLLNKGSRDATNSVEDNKVTIEFVAHLYNNPSYVNEKYWLGAAFEIGSSQIWAGQLEITAGSEADASSMGPPVLTFDEPFGGYQAAIGDPLLLTLNAEIPHSSTTSYTLDVEAPFTTEAIFQLCDLRITSVGSNMPCVNVDDKKAVYSARTTVSSTSDKATLALGGITNLHLEQSNATADLIVFKIIVKPLDLATAGPYDVKATLTYRDTMVVQKTTAVTINGSSSLTVLSNDTSPSFNMSYVFGDEKVLVGTATRIKLEITTNNSVVYPMMNLEYIMPVGNFSTKISVCRARVESVGENLPCVSPDWINSKVTYASRFNDIINDRAIMSLGPVCNVANTNNEEDDKLVITFDVKVEDHADLLQDTKEWISAGNMYSDSKIWVGQLAMYSQRTPATITPASVPYISLYKNTTIATSPIGFPTIYTVLVKLGPQDHAKIKITATSKSSGLFVCGMRVKDVGDNLPCVTKTTKPSFSTFATGGNEQGILDLGIVTNTGSGTLTKNDFYDSDSILVELIMKLSDDTAKVADNSNHVFDVNVEYDSAGNKQDFNGNTISATYDKTVANLSVIHRAINTYYTVGMEYNGTNSSDYIYNSTNIYKGESKRFLIDIVMPEAETQEVIVKFLTSINDPNQMEICSAAVVYVGENFPCLDKTKIDPTFEHRPSSKFTDIASLSLGYICSSPVKSGDTDANKITIETIARLVPTTTKVAGNTIPFHVAVNTNDQEIYVAEMELTVTDTFEEITSSNSTYDSSLLTVNVTGSTVPVKVGEITTFPVIMTVPSMTVTNVLFDVSLPVNDTIIASVIAIRLTGTGVNIGCLYENTTTGMTFEPTYNSSLNSCEKNNAVLDFGLVANSGLTNRKGTYAEKDDQISVEVDIQLHDGETMENGMEYWFSFGAKLEKYVVIYEKKISVLRDNTEKPILELTAEVNTTLSTSSVFVIEAVLQHSNLSTATGVNTSAIFYLPPYIQYKTYTSNVTDTSVSFTDGAVRITYAVFKFCDIAAITLTLEPNTSIEVPEEIVTDNTMVAFEAGAFMYYRSGNPNSNIYHTSDLQYLNFSATVIRADQCGGALGMETGTIDDCQLSSSIEYDPARRPSHGRLHGNSAWSPFIRGSSFAKHRYYQIFFGNKTLVNRIDIQMGDGFNHRPTKVTLKYSNNGQAWQTGETVNLSPSFTIESVYPVKQVEAKYLRIYIDKDDAPANTPSNIGLRFEFYGCYKTSEVTTLNICGSAPTNSYPNDFYFRSFHVYNGKVFTCDVDPNDPDVKQHCHSSADGNTWFALDEKVGSLLGHESSTNSLYAYANDIKTRLRSKDGGVTWKTVPDNNYLDDKVKLTFVPAKKVPWTTDKLDGLAEPHADYRMSNWGATYDGMWKNSAGVWSQVSRWEQCCA